MSKWIEASAGDVIQMKEGDRLEGKFVSLTESTKFPGSWALKLDIDGKIKATFINNILRDTIIENDVQKGEEIAVLFAAMIKNQAKTFEYKDYKLFLNR